MTFRFTWDPEKAKQNRRKHFVSFYEAVTIFDDPLSLTIADESHSAMEEHFITITIGESTRGRLLGVVHAEEGATIRLISARAATRHERTNFEEGRCCP